VYANSQATFLPEKFHCTFTLPRFFAKASYDGPALRKDLDPLPLFEAKAVSIDGVEVVVIRVQASSLTPHVYLPGGAIYIREPGGRHPIKSQAELLTLAISPEQAKARAVQRMTTLPLVLQALGPHDLGPAANGQTRVADWMVTAGPLTVPDVFRKRALSETVVKAARTRLAEQLGELEGLKDGWWDDDSLFETLCAFGRRRRRESLRPGGRRYGHRRRRLRLLPLCGGRLGLAPLKLVGCFYVVKGVFVKCW